MRKKDEPPNGVLCQASRNEDSRVLFGFLSGSSGAPREQTPFGTLDDSSVS